MSAPSILVTKSQAATVSFAFTHPDGSPFSLAGCTVTFTVKKDSASAPVISGIGSVAGNVASFALTPTDTDLAIRAWQAKLDLVDTNGQASASRTFYLVITSRQVDDASTSVVVGNTQVAVSVDVTPPASDLPRITVSSIPPSNPSVGDLWVDTT